MHKTQSANGIVEVRTAENMGWDLPRTALCAMRFAHCLLPTASCPLVVKVPVVCCQLPAAS